MIDLVLRIVVIYKRELRGVKGRIKRIERALTLAFVCLSPVIHHGLISTASEGEYDDVCEDH